MGPVVRTQGESFLIYSAGNTCRLKRVLFLINLDPSLKFGSMEEQILFMAKAFRARGSLFFPLFVSSMKEKEKAEYQTAGLVGGHLDLRRFSLASLRGLLSLITRHEIEVVHWNLYHPLNAYVWFLTMLKPHVAHFLTDHNSRTSFGYPCTTPMTRGIRRVMLRRYSRVLCVSDFVMQDLERQGMWSNLSRYHHFINTDRFKPDPCVRIKKRRELGAEKLFILLVVAHLIREKGVDVAIKALRELPSHVVLWIIGGGPERRALQELVDQLGLQDRVVLWGVQRNVEQYMQAADCFICPSVWAEAAGLVILEALGCGMPVIASKIGGIPEFVEEGKTGFLFPAGDYLSLAERVARLLTIPKLTLTIGQQARSTAVADFSVESRLSELLTDYEAAPRR
jgi:L-malate glycosyltransferase